MLSTRPVEVAQAEYGELTSAGAGVGSQADQQEGLVGDEQCLQQPAVMGLRAEVGGGLGNLP